MTHTTYITHLTCIIHTIKLLLQTQEACERYQNLSGEEKDLKIKKARERYQNLTEEENE